jgi:hypothetical protein
VRPDMPSWLTGWKAGRVRIRGAICPATSAILPFLLLIMAVGRLPMVNPTPVFGRGCCWWRCCSR